MSNKQKTAADGTYPRLENWVVTQWFSQAIIDGLIYNDTRWEDGTRIYTSAIVKIDTENEIVETRNTLYKLGVPKPQHKVEDPND